MIHKRWKNPATVQPSPAFLRLLDQVTTPVCSIHHGNPGTPLFCTKVFDIGVLEEEFHEVVGHDFEEGLALSTEEGDCPELLDVSRILLLVHPHSLCILPLLRHFPFLPDPSEDLPKTLQQAGTVFEGLIWDSTCAWRRCCPGSFNNFFSPLQGGNVNV